MQNRYAGDVGDFGKYGLLRALVRADSIGPALRLGLVWYLTDLKSLADDGKHVSYVIRGNESFRECDAELFDCLRALVLSENRSVGAVHGSGVLGRETASFDELLSFDGLAGVQPRLQHRAAWLERALHATSACDIVFFDPDNGIEPKASRSGRTGPKHVYLNELMPFADLGQSLVIYHHLYRVNHAQQIETKRRQLADALECDLPVALRYGRGTARAFFIVPNVEHGPLIEARVDDFLSSAWSSHFQRALTPTDAAPA